MTSRSTEKGEEAVKEIKSDNKTKQMFNAGGDIKAVKMDLDDEKSCENAVKDLEKEYGRVDVIIHNAGKFLSVSNGSRSDVEHRLQPSISITR